MGVPYSTRFVLETVPPGGDPAAYTVPAGKVAIVQCIDARNNGGADDFLIVYVDPLTVDASPIVLFAAADAPAVSAHWEGKLVLFDGEQLALTPGSGLVSWDVQVSGALLDA